MRIDTLAVWLNTIGYTSAQLAAFAQQGYITRGNGLVKSKIEYRDGKLSVNGKPFDPAAMGGAGAAVAEPMPEAPPPVIAPPAMPPATVSKN